MLFPVRGCTANVYAGRQWIGRFVLATLTVMLTACGGGGGSSAEDVSLSVQATKTFRFDGADVSGANHYQLLKNPDGISDLAQVGEGVPQATETVDLPVPLYNRVNGDITDSVASDPDAEVRGRTSGE